MGIRLRMNAFVHVYLKLSLVDIFSTYYLEQGHDCAAGVKQCLGVCLFDWKKAG